jgi:hypothetical protein
MWFKRKKRGHDWQDNVANKIVQTCIFLQSKWTMTLNKKTNQWSSRTKRVFLVAVIIVLGGYSFFILIRTLTSSGNHQLPIQELVKAPVVPSQIQRSNRIIFTSTDTLKIQQFRRLLDSLRTTPSGREQYDDFMRRHPGLMDSLQKVEQMMREPFPF